MKPIGKLLVAAFVITVGIGFGAAPVAAGGWAMTSLDAAPNPVAGRSEDIGFTIRQHGVTPANPQGEVGIEVRDAAGTEHFFRAIPQGPPGHYVAAVRIDEPGASTWTVRQAWFGPQQLGRIEVAPPGSTPVTGPGAPTATAGSTGGGAAAPLGIRLLLPAIGLALGGFALADAVATRRRRARELITT
jgi:hypothetical protein